MEVIISEGCQDGYDGRSLVCMIGRVCVFRVFKVPAPKDRCGILLLNSLRMSSKARKHSLSCVSTCPALLDGQDITQCVDSSSSQAH